VVVKYALQFEVIYFSPSDYICQYTSISVNKGAQLLVSNLKLHQPWKITCLSTEKRFMWYLWQCLFCLTR